MLGLIFDLLEYIEWSFQILTQIAFARKYESLKGLVSMQLVMFGFSLHMPRTVVYIQKVNRDKKRTKILQDICLSSCMSSCLFLSVSFFQTVICVLWVPFIYTNVSYKFFVLILHQTLFRYSLIPDCLLLQFFLNIWYCPIQYPIGIPKQFNIVWV